MTKRSPHDASSLAKKQSLVTGSFIRTTTCGSHQGQSRKTALNQAGYIDAKRLLEISSRFADKGTDHTFLECPFRSSRLMRASSSWIFCLLRGQALPIGGAGSFGLKLLNPSAKYGFTDIQ